VSSLKIPKISWLLHFWEQISKDHEINQFTVPQKRMAGLTKWVQKEDQCKAVPTGRISRPRQRQIL
jgi:hypothetical protein